MRAGGVTGRAVVPTEAGVNQLRALFPAGASPNLDRYLAIVGDLRGTTNLIHVPLGGGRDPIEFGTATRFSAQPVNTYDYLARVDWSSSERTVSRSAISRTSQLFSNQFPDPSTGIAGSQFPGFEIDVPSLTQNIFLSDTYVFSPRTVNEARFGYGRFNLFFGPRDTELVTSGPQFLFAGTTISTVGLSQSFPQGRIFNNFQFQDTVTHTAGNHTLRVGTDILMQRAKQFVPINTRGTLTFAAGGGFPAFRQLCRFVLRRRRRRGGEGVWRGPRLSQRHHARFLHQRQLESQTKPDAQLRSALRALRRGRKQRSRSRRSPASTLRCKRASSNRHDNNNFGPRLSFA